jgi:hypothetical protein
LLLVGGPAAILAALVAVVAIELWVRSIWDHHRGTPGIFLSDARRGQRLAAGYNGWFAGVPVRINSLGFRDPREYTVDKAPGTFRILIIGDSVTFGHGAVFETTYPYLFEQQLEQWRDDVRWEVWNLGVPGYNTRQELAYLEEVGPVFKPDLVVIGFYPNDFTGNESVSEPGWLKVASTSAIRFFQRHLYSFEFYKRAYLTARWKLSSDDDYRRRLEHLQIESDLLSGDGPLVDAPQQRLTPVERFDDEEVRGFVCVTMPRIDESKPGELAGRIRANAPEVRPWMEAVRKLQQLAREGMYRIVFFINIAPEHCPHMDRFYNAGSIADDNVLQAVLGDGTPVVSSARTFLHYRPSQMPLASGHSLGNSNLVKATVLFDFLRERALPGLLPERAVQ